MNFYFTYYQNGIVRHHTCYTEKEAIAYFDLLIIMKVESIRILTAKKR